MIETVQPIGTYYVQATNAQIVAFGNSVVYVMSNVANDTAIIELVTVGGGGN